MLFFFNKKQNLIIKDQVIAIWGPSGSNTSKVSWPLAKEISRHTSIALVELPCQGIPRLAIEAEILDRQQHTEAAILDYERKNGNPINLCHRISETFSLLAANPYGLPDHPVVHKVTRPETLQFFPNHFANQARKSGYNVIAFDCQGTLVSPMTFFALHLATKIILVADSPSEIAWALVNKERLIDTYKIKQEAFIATTINTAKQYYSEIEKVLKCPVLSTDGIVELIADSYNDREVKSL